MEIPQDISSVLRETVSIKKPLLSIVIPLFNDRNNLKPLFRELDYECPRFTDVEVEYILVDDGSRDQTFAVASEICSKRSRAKALRLARNYGAHAAIAAGLSMAKGDCAVFIASDLQDPPAVIAEMIKQWQAGFKVVFASRSYVEKQPFSERFFSQCFWFVFNIVAAYPLPARGVDFALLDRIVVNIIKDQAHLRIPTFCHIVETGFPCAIVKYVKRPRNSGKSGWTWHKKFSYVFQTLNSSTKFFRLMVLLAGLITFGSLFCQWVCRGQSNQLFVIGTGLSLIMLMITTLMLIMAERLSFQLKGVYGSPRFVVAEKVSMDDGD